jgi:Ni/Co efflux regulator RcnB
MKKLTVTLLAFFAFTALATAQERQDQQPPTVTEQQVVKDAKVAQQAKADKEKAMKEQAEKQKKEEDKRVTNNEGTTVTKKASTKPGKQ